MLTYITYKDIEEMIIKKLNLSSNFKFKWFYRDVLGEPEELDEDDKYENAIELEIK